MEKIEIRQIREQIKELMKENGFHMASQRYIRVTEKQICQVFGFQEHTNGELFTINVGITGLCECDMQSFFPEGIRIGMIMGKGDVWWKYNNEGVQEAVKAIMYDMMPLLEKCSTYEGFYHLIEEQIDLTPNIDRDFTNLEVRLYLSKGPEALFRLCMKLGEYEKAALTIQKNINDVEWGVKKNVECYDEMIENTGVQKYIDQWVKDKDLCRENGKKEVSRLMALKERVQQGDYADILKDLADTEEKNLANMKRYTVGITQEE